MFVFDKKFLDKLGECKIVWNKDTKLDFGFTDYVTG